jgi:hypothetical protein
MNMRKWHKGNDQHLPKYLDNWYVSRLAVLTSRERHPPPTIGYARRKWGYSSNTDKYKKRLVTNGTIVESLKMHLVTIIRLNSIFFHTN